MSRPKLSANDMAWAATDPMMPWPGASNIGTHVPHRLGQIFTAMAKLRGISTSALVRELIGQYVASNHEDRALALQWIREKRAEWAAEADADREAV